MTVHSAGSIINKMPFDKLTSQEGLDRAMNKTIDRMKVYGLPDEEIADALAQWKGGACPVCRREYAQRHSNIKVQDKNNESVILSDFIYYEPLCKCLSKLSHSRQEEERLQKIILESGIPNSMREITFDVWDYSVSDATTACMTKSRNMLQDGSFFSGLGAVLCGTPGVGKTHVGISMLRWIMENSKLEATFVPMADIIGRIIRSGKDKDYEEEIRLYDVVMLDDIDKVHSQSEWVKQKIFSIIDGMLRAKKHIIITTNMLTMLDFDEKFDLSIASRLVGECTFVMFPEGNDYRKLKKKRELLNKRDHAEKLC